MRKSMSRYTAFRSHSNSNMLIHLARACRIEEAEDSGDPKGALVDLVAEAEAVAVAAALVAAADAETKRAALKDELNALRVGAVRKKALACGVSQDEIDDADEADVPKVALIELIIANSKKIAEPTDSDHASGNSPAEKAARKLRDELALLKYSQLRKRAVAAGLGSDAIEEAEDSDDPKGALVDIVVEHEGDEQAAEQEAMARELKQFEAELELLKVSQLRRRAVSSGVSDALIEEAEDSGNTRAALLTLLVTRGPSARQTHSVPPPQQAAVAATASEVASLKEQVQSVGHQSSSASKSTSSSNRPTAAKVRSHHGNGLGKPQGTAGHAAGGQGIASGKAVLPSTFDMSGKHVMISYSWAEQEVVKRISSSLSDSGLTVWMDIEGGMSVDVYDSMAIGVQNAACIVACMSANYQKSENCKLELKFSRQLGVPIVPVRLEIDPDWRATDWLGIVTAGMLWTSVHLDDHFDCSVEKLVQVIMSAAQLESTGAVAKVELVSELKRLDVDIKGATRVGNTAWDDETDESWRDQPARLNSIIPDLPDDFRLTNDIAELTRLVRAQGQNQKRAIGFFGMGGIGKTVTGAAVCRADGVREWFDRVIWVTLGQNPIIPKLQ